MLTLKMLRDNPDFVVKKLAVKNFDAKAIVDETPKAVKEGVAKAEAEEMKAKLEEAGAKVELK